MKRLLVLIILLFLVGCVPQHTDTPMHSTEEPMSSQMRGHVMQDMPGMQEIGVSIGEYLPNVDVTTLDEAKKSAIIDLEDGDSYEIEAGFVKKTINGNEHVMYAYNGMIPGPLLHVKQTATITVQFTNNIDMETTIHWHGLRHDNKDDGVPDVTQQAVQPGETFTYTVRFPDEGVYWYHPHVREDIQQDLGLYGNMIVDPAQQGYFNPVNAQEYLVFDDILIDNGLLVPYGKNYATHALMGRFGNVMLVNGDTDYALRVKAGDVVRFMMTNVANTRMFNISIPSAKMKLVGSDIGAYEKEEFVGNIVIASAERYIVDVLFENEGEYALMHTNPQKTYVLGKIIVQGETDSDHAVLFSRLSTNEQVVSDIDSYREHFDRPIDHTIDLSVEMEHKMQMDHLEPIEWEDSMPFMNSQMTSEDTTWKLVDRSSGKENMDIDYQFKVGDIVKIRIFNDPESPHPMQHPIHFHGQRFLVISHNGVQQDNLVWKDTVLVPAGEYVDILLDVTNPGEWMAHCHIAEHLTSGMMLGFNVEE